jgi:hypothetical protein
LAQDLISYEVASLTPFKVRECVPGEGQLLGSMFLESSFRRFANEEVAKQVDMRRADRVMLNAEIDHAGEVVKILNATT